MIDIRKLLSALNLEETLVEAVLSQSRKSEAGLEAPYDKAVVRPIYLKEQLHFQVEGFIGPKALHENHEPSLGVARLIELGEQHYKQLMLKTTAFDYDIKINRLGQASVKRSAAPKTRVVLGHNREKDYLLKDGVPVDFLIRLGVMDEAGKVFKKKYDKFKQLNRFLEFVDDCLPALKARLMEKSEDAVVRIIDFGCGKAYLTFALYHYLVKQAGLAVEIVGLDLKEDVIDYCSEVAKDLNYEGLSFLMGDIVNYEGASAVDMVVTLHACDNATDEALVKAADWGAKVILSVPCCQHEFFKALSCDSQAPIIKHGILRDKMNSLVTDALRGLALEGLGYEVQMLEFIDMTHTPKNVLIRAYLAEAKRPADLRAFETFMAHWGLEKSYLKTRLKERGLT